MDCQIPEFFTVFDGLKFVESHNGFIPLRVFSGFKPLLKEQHAQDLQIDCFHLKPADACNVSNPAVAARGQNRRIEKICR